MLDIERKLNKEGSRSTKTKAMATSTTRDTQPSSEGQSASNQSANRKLMDMAGQFAGMGGGGDDKGKAKATASARAPVATGRRAGGPGGADPLGFLGPLITPVAQNISDNMRLVELEVSWPEGKHRSKFSVKRDCDFARVEAIDHQRSRPTVTPGAPVHRVCPVHLARRQPPAQLRALFTTTPVLR